MNLCACGCGNQVKKIWSIGHNRKNVSPTNFKGGHTSKSGYCYKYVPQHPQRSNSGYVEEHRLVMEKHVGRYLERNEVVHHLNQNKSDNRIENLQLLTKKAHDRIGVLVSENCKVINCINAHKARGLCASHYGKFYRKKVEMPLKPSRRSRWNRK